MKRLSRSFLSLQSFTKNVPESQTIRHLSGYRSSVRQSGILCRFSDAGILRRFSSCPSSVDSRDNTENTSHLKLSYACYERGKDASKKPPILIHHNLCGRKENFTNLGKQLFHVTGRSIILPDARNHGNSPESASMSHKLMSGDLTHLLSSLKVKQVSFIGVGMGGRIGMYTALTRPDMVEKLVIVTTSPVNTEQRLRQADNLNESFYVIQTLLAAHHPQNHHQLLKSQQFRLEVNSALQHILPNCNDRAMFISNLGQFNMSAIHSNPGLFKFPLFNDCVFKKPVLFVTGDRETISSYKDDEIRKIRAQFTDSHFVKISKSGLYPNLDNASEFVEVVTSFLETDQDSMCTLNQLE